MVIDAVKCVLLIVVAYLALVGLAHLCVTVGRWFSSGGALRDCWLVVAALPGEEDLEMRLRQAHALLQADPAFRGVGMVVADSGADKEARDICRCFSQETGVPFLHTEELPRFLNHTAPRQPETPGAVLKET